jgi:geranylgeranyl pyrophosphate synthase
MKNLINEHINIFFEKLDKKYPGHTILWNYFKKHENGKLLRPSLFLKTFEHTGKKIENIYYDIAAGIEMLHIFALIHDDIVDKSDYRRNNLSFHKMLEKKFGENSTGAAIIAGDILYTGALEYIYEKFILINKIEVFGFIMECSMKTALGQWRELTEDYKINEKEIFSLYDSKTSIYTFLCPVITALKISEQPEKISEYTKDCMIAGKIYQLKNDIADISENQNNEPFFEDFKTRRKNYVYYEITKNKTKKEKEEIDYIYQKKEIEKFKKIIQNENIILKIQNLIKTLETHIQQRNFFTF